MPDNSPLRKLQWQPLLIALCAGALLPLSFAPFNWWPMGLISAGILALLLYGTTAASAFQRSWAFALGMYGTGVSWVFVSINDFGNASPPFAVLLTLLLVIVLATFFATPFILLGRYWSRKPLALLLAMPALWVIGEWIRSWLFTGFPWLYMGYGHLDTWLSGWAPVTGVMGISFAAVLTATALAYAWLEQRRGLRFTIPLMICVLGWGGGYLLQDLRWTTPHLEPIRVGLVQGNVPQERKWDPGFLRPTLERYYFMSEELWADHDWVVWPEAAVPLLYHQAQPFLTQVKERALEHDAALITGVLYDSREDYAYYNSIIALGMGAGIYHKQRLVPFGDYVPLRHWFGPVLSLFDLPMSILQPGPANQNGLQVGAALASPSICYEIAYPDSVARAAMEAMILITISNDAWFGASIGPLQHMQIAQMRALETGRYLIRATNNGVSAIVNDRGEILARSEQFVQQTLSAEVELRQGATPFMRWGSEPLLFLCLLSLGAAVLLQRLPALLNSPQDS